MKATMHSTILVFFAILQPTLINSIAIGNITPNLFLVYSIVICCFSGKTEGSAVGFASGFILDMLVGRIWGLYALLGLISGFFISYFCERAIRNSNILVTIIFVFLGSMTVELLYYLTSLLLVDNVNLMTAIIRIILPESFYNLIMSIPIYFLINKFAKSLYLDKGEIIG